MSAPVVGIDLGTSTTVVAHADAAGRVTVLADEAGAKIQPSVVSFHPNGGVIVGAAAKQRRVIDPHNTVYSVKRLIGRSFGSPEVQTARTRVPYKIEAGPQQAPMIVTRAGTFAVPEISAIVLDHARHIASARLGTPVHPVARAVVTVPASFNDAQRAATATAGAIAGLEVVRVLNEPTAAALAYGHARNLRETIAVYDFGGGTFDVTILRLADQVYEVLGTAGDTFLGGDDLDERLVDRMVAQFLVAQRIDLRTNEVAMMRLRAVAEQTKIELSRRARALVRIDEIAYGDSGAPLDLRIEITRDELVMQIADIVDRTFPVCQEALALAGLGIDGISDVLLVGGTTKIPYVRDQVSRFFGKAPRTDVNPEEAVAVGAALQASTLQRRPVVAVAQALDDEPTIDLPTGATMAPSEVTPPPIPKRQATAAYPAVRPDTSYKLTRGGVRDVYQQRGTPPAPPPAAPLGRMTKPAPASTGVPPPPPTTSRGQPAQRAPSPSDLAPRAASVTAPELDATITRAGFDDSFSDVDQLRDVPDGPARAVPPSAPDRERHAHARAVPPSAPDRERHVPARAVPPSVPRDEGDLPAAARASSSRAHPGVIGETRTAPAGSHADGGPRGALPPQTFPIVQAADPAALPPSTRPRGLAAAPVPLEQAHGAPPPTMPVVPMAAPVILDVTPRGLRIGTVAGYCEALIERNVRLPAAIKRLFTTARDRQDQVRLVVCQGDSRRMNDNTVIGDLVLADLPPRPRGETSIEVTFALDASGILQVHARDAQTGNEQRATLDLVGGMADADVAASRDRVAALRR